MNPNNNIVQVRIPKDLEELNQKLESMTGGQRSKWIRDAMLEMLKRERGPSEVDAMFKEILERLDALAATGIAPKNEEPQKPRLTRKMGLKMLENG